MTATVLADAPVSLEEAYRAASWAARHKAKARTPSAAAASPAGGGPYTVDQQALPGASGRLFAHQDWKQPSAILSVPGTQAPKEDTAMRRISTGGIPAEPI